MPTYDYKCPGCGYEMEVEKRMSDPDPIFCPECGDYIKQVISASGFTLKGRGWYETDFKHGEGANVRRKKGDGE